MSARDPHTTESPETCSHCHATAGFTRRELQRIHSYAIAHGGGPFTMPPTIVRHNLAHQTIRDDAPYLYGDHMSDECADRSAYFNRDYAPGSGPREDDDPEDDE